MKQYPYIQTLFLCGMLLCSCTQHELYPDDTNDNHTISFQTGEVLTRGFLGYDELRTTGSKLRMYGYHDDVFVGEAKGKPFNGNYIVSETIDGIKSWNIVDANGNPLTYYWEGEGTYRFFGWLAYDAANQLSIPTTFTYSNDTKQLTIPATVLGKDYNQFDFLYSEVHERTIDEHNIANMIRQAVPVNMKHLYTAFGVGFKNHSGDPITITKVALERIHDQGSAVIDYSNGNSVVTYGATSISRTTGTPFISYDTSYEVAPNGGQIHNVFNPNDTERRYYMLWPQAADIVSPTTPHTPTDPRDLREYEATDSILVIKYILGGTECERRVKLPAENWEAGKKYFFELQVIDKLVELTSTVTPWEYTSTEVDFTQSAVEVNSEGRLAWDANTCTIDHANQKVYVRNGQPVEATFCIDAPLGGQWRVSLEGDVAAFSIVDDTAPTNDGFGPIDGQIHRIRIRPNISSPDRDYAVRLKFVAITADSKTLPADNMVQNTDADEEAEIYTIILPKA